MHRVTAVLAVGLLRIGMNASERGCIVKVAPVEVPISPFGQSVRELYL